MLIRITPKDLTSTKPEASPETTRTKNMKRIKVGDTVGIRKLRNAFGTKCPHLVSILGDALQSVPRESRKERRKWKVVAELPTPEAYPELRAKRFTTTVGALIDDGYSQAESVGEELRDWYDNLPESFQMGDKGDLLSEGADAIENAVCEKPDELPAHIADLPVVHVPDVGTSRSAQLCEAAGMLRAALSELPESAEDEDLDLDDVRSTLEQAADEFEGVECPGMFG